MKQVLYIIVLLALASTVLAAGNSSSEKMVYLIHYSQQVCGSDGITYLNEFVVPAGISYINGPCPEQVNNIVIVIAFIAIIYGIYWYSKKK